MTILTALATAALGTVTGVVVGRLPKNRAVIGLAAPSPAEADVADYAHCPAEGRRTPHALRSDGSRRCWSCRHETGAEL